VKFGTKESSIGLLSRVKFGLEGEWVQKPATLGLIYR